MAIVRGTLQDINDIYPTGLGPIVPLESMSPSGVVTVPPVVASHPGTNGGLLARTTATTTLWNQPARSINQISCRWIPGSRETIKHHRASCIG